MQDVSSEAASAGYLNPLIEEAPKLYQEYYELFMKAAHQGGLVVGMEAPSPQEEFMGLLMRQPELEMLVIDMSQPEGLRIRAQRDLRRLHQLREKFLGQPQSA